MLKMNNITKTFNSGTVDERVALDHRYTRCRLRGE